MSCLSIGSISAQVTSISGTSNQVYVNASTGNVIISLPQSIASSSSPTFSGATLSNTSIANLQFSLTGSSGYANVYYDGNFHIDASTSNNYIVLSGNGYQSRVVSFRSTINGTDLASINTSGYFTANEFIKSGGTSSQFLKADGSLDSNTYLTGSSAIGYVGVWDGTNSLTGYNKLFWDSSNNRLGIGGTPSYTVDIKGNSSELYCQPDWGSGKGVWLNLSTDGPSGIGTGGAGQSAWIAYASGSSFWFSGSSIGDICYRNLNGRLLFGTTTGAPAMSISNNLVGIGTTAPTHMLDVNGTGNFFGTLTGTSATFSSTLAASSFVKTGGTSFQFLKADGSLDSNPYLTGSSAIGYIGVWNGTNSLTGYNKLFWDSSNNRLGIGGTPSYTVDIKGNSSELYCQPDWGSGKGVWLNLSTDGPSGIGTGGAGQSAWIAYASGSSFWFSGSSIGDICYRNLSGRLLFGTTSGAPALTISNNLLGVGTVSPVAKIDVFDNTLSGSGSLSGSLINLAQTWNTTANPTSIKLNVTATANGSGSKLIDLQIGGISKFNVDYLGNVTGTKYIVRGGTSSQFLKADGSVDSTTYLTASSNRSDTIGYLPQFSTNNSFINSPIFSDSAKVGIGTTNPIAKLQLGSCGVSNTDTYNILIDTYRNDMGLAQYSGNWVSDGRWGIGPLDNTHSNTIRIGNVDNSNGIWRVIQNLNLVVGGKIGIGMVNPVATLDVNGTGNFSGTLTGTSATFSGNVGIGTAHPDTAYLLDVFGTIRAKEVLVDLTGVPDFVFEKGYKLTSLEQVSSYVQKNKHLPDIPSAKEIEKNGVSLSEMQNKLLQKIEELTLYAIEQNKKIEHLEQQNAKLEQLEKRIEELENK